MKAGEGIDNPNGIQLSRDEKTLYVNNTRGEYLHRVRHPGRRHAREQAQLRQVPGPTKGDKGLASGADGLAVDSEGRVYVAINSTGGVQIFSPEGQYLGTIPTSSRRAEPRVRRPRQEDALCRRSRRGVQGPDAVAGFSGTGQIAGASEFVCPLPKALQTRVP